MEELNKNIKILEKLKEKIENINMLIAEKYRDNVDIKAIEYIINFIENLQKENEKLRKENEKLRKEIKEIIRKKEAFKNLPNLGIYQSKEPIIRVLTELLEGDKNE